jgi:hypothetical protein
MKVTTKDAKAHEKHETFFRVLSCDFRGLYFVVSVRLFYLWYHSISQNPLANR